MLCDIKSLLKTGGRGVVATTGLNANEFILDEEMPDSRTIWLDADLDTLDARVAAKPVLPPDTLRGIVVEYLQAEGFQWPREK